MKSSTSEPQNLPPSLYRDGFPPPATASGIADIFVLVCVCGLFAAVLSAEGGDSFNSSQTREAMMVGAGIGLVIGLIVGCFHAPRAVSIPAGVLIGPLVGAAVFRAFTANPGSAWSAALIGSGAVAVMALVLRYLRRRTKRAAGIG